MKLSAGSTRGGPNTLRRSAKTWEVQAAFQKKARAFPCARGAVLSDCCLERRIRHFDSGARTAKANRSAPARAKTDLSHSGDQGMARAQSFRNLEIPGFAHDFSRARHQAIVQTNRTRRYLGSRPAACRRSNLRGGFWPSGETSQRRRAVFVVCFLRANCLN